MYAPIFIGIAIVMIALGLLVSLIAGVRNLYIGKADIKKIITFAVPFVVFGIAYSSIGVAGDAAIATMVIMLALMALAIVVSGVRSTFNI